MAKKTYRENFRVTVNPRHAGDYGFIKIYDAAHTRTEREEEVLCEQIARDIKRHVDDVGSTEVKFDTASTCSFCGAQWTEDGDAYNGGCCDEEEANKSAEAA